MSTINVRASKDAASSVAYILYGRTTRARSALEGEPTRAAAFALSMDGVNATPSAFVERAKTLADAHSRKIQVFSYVLAFHPDEFDVADRNALDRVRDVAVSLVERMHSADYMVAVHSDSAGGHAHAHILVINHDYLTGKSLRRYTSWKHGLHQLNDQVMSEEGLQVLPDPVEPKPDWELRREKFTAGGFEQSLGDRVYASLADKRSISKNAFEAVLAEHGVALAVTDRDGWSYKMRRTNGKFGRRKASSLTGEFTAEEARKVFDYHSKAKQRLQDIERARNEHVRRFEGLRSEARRSTGGRDAGHPNPRLGAPAGRYGRSARSFSVTAARAALDTHRVGRPAVPDQAVPNGDHRDFGGRPARPAGQRGEDPAKRRGSDKTHAKAGPGISEGLDFPG